VIKFGESSRLYVLLGPPQFEVDTHASAASTTGEKAEEMMQQQQQEDEDNEGAGVSWGMRDDPSESGEFGAMDASKELDTSEDGLLT